MQLITLTYLSTGTALPLDPRDVALRRALPPIETRDELTGLEGSDPEQNIIPAEEVVHERS
jgi:hypothetical protein